MKQIEVVDTAEDSLDRTTTSEDDTEAQSKEEKPLEKPPRALIFTEDELLAQCTAAKRGFWDQPWPFRTTCYMLFSAAIVQGWNQTSTNGANVWWLDELIYDPLSSAKPSELNVFGCIAGPEDGIKYGVITAAPFLFGFV